MRGHRRRGAREERAHLGMHGEIRVALPIALLGIGESRMPHASRRPRSPPCRTAAGAATSRASPRPSTRTGHLARARAKQRARHADDVADVEQLERAVRVVAQLVLAEVELDAADVVGEMRERRLAVRATPRSGPRPRPPGPSRPRVAVERASASAARVRAVEAVRERRDARAPRARASFSRRAALDEVRAPRRSRALPPRAHAALPPIRFRYASMNGSMSPSITFCTSGIFSSVRWSLTMV